MGDAASTLISGPTEEALREAAQEEVQQLTKVFTKMFMVYSKILGISSLFGPVVIFVGIWRGWRHRKSKMEIKTSNLEVL